jgi:hypothetical protein
LTGKKKLSILPAYGRLFKTCNKSARLSGKVAGHARLLGKKYNKAILRPALFVRTNAGKNKSSSQMILPPRQSVLFLNRPLTVESYEIDSSRAIELRELPAVWPRRAHAVIVHPGQKMMG